MGQHPLLQNLSALLADPGEAACDRFKADGWFTQLWVVGHTEEHPDGQVAISFSASEVEGTERPVLFIYVDEAQARAHNPDEEIVTYPLAVIGMLAQQQLVDLAIVDGEDDVVLTHEQLLALRDLMQLETDPAARNQAADHRFIRGFEAFMQQALDYCRRMPDVTRLHLAAIATGGASMRGGAILEASNRLVHQQALQELFAGQMSASDCLSFFDPLDVAERKLVDAIKQAEPAYVRAEQQGWLARLFARKQQAQVVILQVAIAADDA